MTRNQRFTRTRISLLRVFLVLLVVAVLAVIATA